MCAFVNTGSFTSAQVLNKGSGYLPGDICLHGNLSGGTGFKGTFAVDAVNGSLISALLLNNGENFSFSSVQVDLCYSSTNIIQVVAHYLHLHCIGEKPIAVQHLHLVSKCIPSDSYLQTGSITALLITKDPSKK